MEYGTTAVTVRGPGSAAMMVLAKVVCAVFLPTNIISEICQGAARLGCKLTFFVGRDSLRLQNNEDSRVRV